MNKHIWFKRFPVQDELKKKYLDANKIRNGATKPNVDFTSKCLQVQYNSVHTGET